MTYDRNIRYAIALLAFATGMLLCIALHHLNKPDEEPFGEKLLRGYAMCADAYDSFIAEHRCRMKWLDAISE